MSGLVSGTQPEIRTGSVSVLPRSRLDKVINTLGIYRVVANGFIGRQFSELLAP